VSNESEGKKISLLKELKEIGVPVVTVSQLSNEFIGSIEDMELRTDKYGNRALFVRIQTDSGVVIQKFTKTGIWEFMKSLEALGFSEDDSPIGHVFRWRKMLKGRMLKERWFPVELVEEETEEEEESEEEKEIEAPQPETQEQQQEAPELSDEAKLVYGTLMDRKVLSEKDIENLLRNRKAAKKAIIELIDKGLAEEFRKGGRKYYKLKQ